MSVREAEVLVVTADLLPEATHAKAPFLNFSVVQEDDGAIREFGPPSGEVLNDILVLMTTIDVQEVDRAILESLDGVCEGRPQKC